MMEHVKRKNRRKGFTLTELVAVLAILAVLLAVGIPVAIRAVHAMNLKELDESARSIFLAAQNRMTAMVGSGEFEKFAKTKDPVTGDKVMVAQDLPADPEDFPTTGGHGDKDDLRYLDSDVSAHEAALAELLPAGSIEGDLALDAHRYVVEYNCVTGAVYAVWYSDKDYNYETVCGASRAFNDRLKADPLVGYYGGSGVDYKAAGQMPIPELTLINAEELRLCVKMPDGTGFDPNKIKLEVLLRGETSGAEAVLIDENTGVPTGTVAAHLDEGSTATLVLDTLKPETTYLSTDTNDGAANWIYGMQFKSWPDTLTAAGRAPSVDLIPGEDITVTVRTHYDGADGIFLPGSASVTCNSLFDRVEGHTAYIAYGRHLQNLDAYTSTGRADTVLGQKAAGDGAAITAAEQVQEIDFGKVNGTFGAAGGFTPGNTADNIYYWTHTYGTVGTDGTASSVRTFTSIYNSALKAYNGKSLPIRNMNAAGNVADVSALIGGAKTAGLFAYLPGTDTAPAQLNNIVLVNPAAIAENNVGALVGHANNVTVENCQAYLEGKYAPKDSTTPKITTTGGTMTRVGGLIGAGYGNITIKNSFASVVVEGKGQRGTGGLVGEAHDGCHLAIENSYAAGYLIGGNIVGGLVGHLETHASATVINSYAAGIIESASVTAAGLVAETGAGVTISNSYAAVRYGKAFEAAGSTTAVYGAAPAGAALTNVYYVIQPGVSFQTDSGTGLYSKQLSEMEATGAPALGGAWYARPAKTGDDFNNPKYAAFPYRQIDETKDLESPYPYPQLKAPGTGSPMPMLHYGDWLESVEGTGLLAYYEQYDAASDEYYIWGLDEEGNLINTLKADVETDGSMNFVEKDGYCLLVKDGETAPKGLPVDGLTDPIEITGGTSVTIAGTGYTLYELDKLNDLKQDSYYHQVTVGAEKYWVNPFYACEVVKAGGDKPSAPQAKSGAAGTGTSEAYEGQVVIRSARQLANMAAATGSTVDDDNAAQSRSYVQLMHIDYSLSDVAVGKAGEPAQSPAALNSSGSYDGGHHIIKNLYISSESVVGGLADNAGLFGEAAGTLTGIRLVNVSVKGGSNTGALAGSYHGPVPATGDPPEPGITDCGAYVDDAAAYDKFTVTGSDNTGGLIGSLDGGGLEKCFASVKVEGGNNTGGLVGQIDVSGGGITLTDCYAGGHTEGGSYGSDANVTGDVNVGGLIGLVDKMSSVQLTGVNYSTCSVKVNMDPTSTPTSIGLLIGNGSAAVSTDGTAYALGQAFDNDGNPVMPRVENYLADAIPIVTHAPDTFRTYPYDATLFEKDAEDNPDLTRPKTYPYATNLPAHHGDWVEKKNPVEACFYWEKEGTAYHVYIVGFDGTTPLNSGDPISTLCLDHHSVDDVTKGTHATSNNTSDWGYGTIRLTDTLSGTGVVQNPSARNDVITALKAALTRYSFEEREVTVYTGASADASTNIKSVADSSKTYTLNLGFAAAISMDNNLGTSGNPYQIRNVQQLDNIPDNDGHSYQQTHDLDGSSYTGYSGASNFTGTIGLAGSYNGQSYRVLELKMTNGLFTSVTGHTNLDNIILYSPSGTATVTGSGAPAGGLVGSVTGSGDTCISNCVVAGYQMSNTSQPLGGLVGKSSRGNLINNLRITNSEAVNTLGSNNSYVGGLVGQVSSCTTSITNSYAGGEITSGSYIGGIVGHATSENNVSGIVTYTNVYSYMKFSTPSGNIKYGIGHSDDSVYLYSRYSNCCYWNGCMPNPRIVSDYGYISKKTWKELRTCMDAGTVFGTAKGTYGQETGSTGTTSDYPFPAVVNGYYENAVGVIEKGLVHYGDWPDSSSGDPAAGGPEIFEPCTCTARCTADHVDETCPLCSQSWWYCGTENPAVQNPYVNEKVNARAPLIRQYAEQHGIPQYVDLIQAVMMFETEGEGSDPMQASNCGLNERYPDGITDVEYSIDIGIRHLADCLERAGVTGPADMAHIPLALQGYNFGAGYITWAQEQGGYSMKNAEEYALMMAENNGLEQYGDKGYAAHVLFFYPYKPPQSQCICENKCAKDAVDPYCLVCAVNWESCACKPAPEKCTCESKCTEEAVDKDCPVCAKDWKACAAPEKCTCEAKCTEEAVNEDCPVCSQDWKACAPAPEEKCVCESKCTEGAVNKDCPVCAQDSACCTGGDPAAPAPSGTPAPAAPAENCTCTSKCTEEAKDETCPVCAKDWEACACTDPTVPAPENKGSGAGEPSPSVPPESAGAGSPPMEPALPPAPPTTGDEPGGPEPDPDDSEPEPAPPEEGGTAE